MGYESVTPPLANKQIQSRHARRYGDNSNSKLLAERAVRTKQRTLPPSKGRQYVRRMWQEDGQSSVEPSSQTTKSRQRLSWKGKSITALRFTFGCLWACDAWFKWQPIFISNFPRDLTQSIKGQTPAIAAWLTFESHLVNLNPHFFAESLALIETCIALCLLLGAFTNIASGTGMVLALLGWATIDGLGGLYGQGKIDIGIVIVYLLIFLGLMLSEAGRILGVDYVLTTKLGRWAFLASGAAKQHKELSITVHHRIH